MQYNAILFSLGGDYVVDFFGCKTKQEVWDRLDNMGSRWFFYPFAFVASEKSVVDAPEGLGELMGKRLKTVKRLFKQAGETFPDSMEALVNGVWPLSLLPDILYNR
jgi:hypothetical protein